MDSLEAKLDQYADVIVRIGLNLQPGQRLMINASNPMETMPLIRAIAGRAYQAGAEFVDIQLDDDHMTLARLRHGSDAAIDTFSQMRSDALLKHAQSGGALVSLFSNDPDLFRNEDTDRLSRVQRGAAQVRAPMLAELVRNRFNWVGVRMPSPSWARRIYPDLPADEAISTLWDTVFAMCRINGSDPVTDWQEHIDALSARRDYLNQRRYTALHYTAPGTDLTIGLPNNHHWMTARFRSQDGIDFTANIPTEEVFTMPHRDQVNGTVKASKPLSYNGMLFEDFSVTFKDGKVVDVQAGSGEAVLRNLAATDEGAARLGEVALVPENSPIAASGTVFYDTLYDENAANHIALGQAYKFTMQGGEQMDDATFAEAGGNLSIIHVDFMIGSGQMNVDGIRADGTTEPVMRNGDWAFEV